MNEHSFIKSIHRYLNPDVHVWKIHDTYTGGVPDAMYSGSSGVLFVEYKYIKTLPKRDSTILKTSLSPLQVQWLNRMKESATAALVIGVNSNAIILNGDFSQKISKLRFLKNAVSRQEVADYICQQTHNAGRCYDILRATAHCSRKLTKNMGQKKS
jgi:hypothetical protein